LRRDLRNRRGASDGEPEMSLEHVVTGGRGVEESVGKV